MGSCKGNQLKNNMTKEEVQKRVTHRGEPLDLESFHWDDENSTFISGVSDLIMDFADCHYHTFDICDDCIITTGSGCEFKTGSGCVFSTDFRSIFKTGANCVVVRKDVFEVIELEEGIKIKLNRPKLKGFIKVTDKKKMTLSEVCTKLGYDVEIIE